jgi:selenocysteine lyase/cysteine desulfurase
MSFLKVLGTIVKVIGIASGVVPLVAQVAGDKGQVVLGSVADKLEKALNVVVTVEQTFANVSAASGSGADKLKAATPFVAQIIQQADLLVGKHPKDEAAFTAAVTALTASLADILNSY